MAEKSVAEKLMIKPGKSLGLVDPPADFVRLLGGIPEGVRVVEGQGEKADIILAFIQDRQELEARLGGLKESLTPGGILWIAYHKGTSKVKTDIHRDSINAYAQGLGLQGVAMIAMDEDWAAMRLKVVA